MKKRAIINKTVLERSMQNAARKAREENKALGLPVKQIVGGRLVSVSADGRARILGEPQYGLVKVQRRIIKLK